MKKTKLLLFLLLIVILPVLIVGCSDDAEKEPIVIGEPNWPGILAKNAVTAHILTNIGYEVERSQMTDPIIHQGLVDGELDIYLGSWMPSIKELRDQLNNEFDLVATNMEDGLYTMAVPGYVWEQGVRSYEDLNKYADKFDHKMYVGEAGWAASEVMNQAIEEDTYNLSDWKAITSTQSALMAQMKKSIKNKEWMVFIAWKPHWMNYVFDIKYLVEDPEEIWESPESWVDTLTRKGFAEEYPQVYKFLQQFVPNAELSNKWIYEIGYNEKDPDTVAKKWVKENLDIVEQWLDGVTAPNNKKAIDVLKENITADNN